MDPHSTVKHGTLESKISVEKRTSLLQYTAVEKRFLPHRLLKNAINDKLLFFKSKCEKIAESPLTIERISKTVFFIETFDISQNQNLAEPMLGKLPRLVTFVVFFS
jgi:hypothetical protein